MKSVLFAYPFFLTNSVLEQEWMMPYFPLGLLYLASSVEQAGHEVFIFDGTFAVSEAEFTETLQAVRPDVVCFASLITLRPTTLRLAAQIHTAQVIFGGPDPTSAPEAYLMNNTIVVLGEGEDTLNEILADRPLASVPGIVYGDNQYTAPREPITDLDALPFPSRHLLNMQTYLTTFQETHGYSSITLAASRGCPYGCVYCADSAVGPHFRLRSPQNVAQEMYMLEKTYAPERFRLVDDLAGLGEAWLRDLGQAMQAIGVKTPYEGLQEAPFVDLPMYSVGKGLCGKRNRYIPRLSDHPHAPPALDSEDLQSRWGKGVLPTDA